MRTVLTAVLLVMFILLLTFGIRAQALPTTSDDCLRRLEREAQAGSKVEVTTTSGNTITGRLLKGIPPTTDLLLQPMSRRGKTVRPIPLTEIQQVTLHKPAPGSGYIVFLGLGIGALTGAVVGNSVGNLGFYGSQTTYGGVGMVVGMFVGGTIGSVVSIEIRRAMTIKVDLKCW